MKKFIQTLKNIWTIEELREKILVTLLLLLIYRFGTHIVLPGIDPNKLSEFSHKASQGLLGLFDTFAGGAFSKASILALGIMPYISASIFMQLMTILVPKMQKIQKEGDTGRKKINQWTRYLTAAVTLLQAGTFVAYLTNQNRDALIEAYQPYFWISTVVLLTAGTLFVMWLGEKIQDKGLGNGTSIIIMVGILARLPEALMQEFGAKQVKGGGGLIFFLIEIAVLITVILGLVILVQGVRKIPIIFAQAIMFLPTLISFSSLESGQGIARIFSDPSNAWYMLVYGIMVIAFTFLYTALIFNPKQVSDSLKQSNGFIPGVKPGQPTADYIGQIMDRITLPGAFFLAIAGILPGLIQRTGVTPLFASFFGGTSLLIMVAVILDTLQQIETHLLMRQYDGLMKSGRLQGRQTSSPVSI